jgi:hypothetical protein
VGDEPAGLAHQARADIEHNSERPTFLRRGGGWHYGRDPPCVCDVAGVASSLARRSHPVAELVDERERFPGWSVMDQGFGRLPKDVDFFAQSS